MPNSDPSQNAAALIQAAASPTRGPTCVVLLGTGSIASLAANTPVAAPTGTGLTTAAPHPALTTPGSQ
jgi:hypothetical protein